MADPGPLDPRYRVLVDALEEGFVFQDCDGRVVFSNPAASRILGLTAEQLAGRTAYDPDWHAEFEDGTSDPGRHPSVIALETGRPVSNVVMRVEAATGRAVWVSINARPVFETDDAVPSGVVVSFVDVSEQRSTQRALRESVDRFRMLFDGTEDAVQFFDGETLRLIDFNDANVRLYGYSRDELAGMSILELSAEPDETRRLARATIAGSTYRIPKRLHRRRDGSTFPVALSAGAFELGGRRVGYSLVRDVSERVAAEEALRESEQKLATLLEHSSDVVIVLDSSGSLQYVSPSAPLMFGFPLGSHLGSDVFDLVHPDDRTRARAALVERVSSTTRRDPFEARVEHADGSWRHLEFVATNLLADPTIRGIVLNARDVTDRRAAEAALRNADLDRQRREAELERNRLEAELAQAQRLESVGRLAGGVAHDFNNLLGVILNYAGFVAKQLDPGDPIAADVAEIRRAAERATDLTRQLLLFGRREVVRSGVFDLNEAIGAALPMLRRTLGEVTLEVELVPEALPVLADRGQIEQVLMNLLLNARDASAGRVAIRTARAGAVPGSPVDPKVELVVADDGDGMAPDVLEQAFDPFFTTKSRDRGSGLGLASVHGIVSRAGGDISVATEPGRGTTVTVTLGLAEGHRPASGASGAETVLVVDDEPEVRVATARILREHGYEVLEAGSGAEAIGLLSVAVSGVTLVVSDVVMPEMSGPQLAERIASVRPEVRVLLMSGYAHDDLEPDSEFRANLLAKPFTESELVDAVRAALGADAAT